MHKSPDLSVEAGLFRQWMYLKWEENYTLYLAHLFEYLWASVYLSLYQLKFQNVKVIIFATEQYVLAKRCGGWAWLKESYIFTGKWLLAHSKSLLNFVCLVVKRTFVWSINTLKQYFRDCMVPTTRWRKLELMGSNL